MGIIKNLFMDKETKKFVAEEKHYSDIFSDLLKIRNARFEVEEKLSSRDLPPEDKLFYQDKLKTYLGVQETIEKGMIRLDKGFYLGVGVDMVEDNPSPLPIYLPKPISNGHTGWQGASGSGKTVGMLNINQQMIAMNDNVIIVDPKGGKGQEVVASTLEAAYECDRMDDVIYFSPAHPNISDQANLLFGMSTDQVSALMHKLASMGAKEKFFPDQVELSTKSISSSFEFIEKAGDPTGEKTKKLIEFEVLKWKHRKQSKGIDRVVVDAAENLMQPDSIETALKDADFTAPLEAEYKYNWTLMTFADLLEQAKFSQLMYLKEVVEGTILPSGISAQKKQELEHMRAEALATLETVLALGEQFYVKVSSSFGLLLNQLSSGPVGSIMCGSRINPMEIHLTDPNKRLIAILQPFPLRFKTVSSMMTKMLTMSLEAMSARVGASGREQNARTHLVVDEAGSAIYEGISGLFSQARGLGLTLWMYTQSFADWDLVLGKDGARVVMENLNTQIRGRMNDRDSAGQVTVEFGQATVMGSRTMTGDTDGNVENRYMIDKEEVDRVPLSEVMSLDTGTILLKMDKHRFVVDVPYYSGPKGVISMPEMEDELLISELIQFENECELTEFPELADMLAG